MADLTWHTGCAGSQLDLNVDWFDERGVKQATRVTLRIVEERPRTLIIEANGVEIGRIVRTTE